MTPCDHPNVRIDQLEDDWALGECRLCGEEVTAHDSLTRSRWVSMDERNDLIEGQSQKYGGEE